MEQITGSDKQIAWATTIRSEILDRIAGVIATLEQAILDDPDTYGSRLSLKRLDGARAMLAAVEAWTDGGEIINWRAKWDLPQLSPVAKRAGFEATEAWQGAASSAARIRSLA